MIPPHAAELRTALEQAARRTRRGSPARAFAGRILDTQQRSAALAVLLFPRWAEDLCGARLPRGERALLTQAQAHLLAWILVRDGVADGGRGEDLPDLLPLLLGAVQRLARLFDARDPFWAAFDRLVREQVASDRWERAPQRSLRFGPALVRRLGHKAALLRWPAFAVARRLGRARSSVRIDAAFDDLLAALQLLDDLGDAAADAASGQPNAVLAAGNEAPVRAAALRLVRPLARLPGGLGAFAAAIVESQARAKRFREAAALLAHIAARIPEPASTPA